MFIKKQQTPMPFAIPADRPPQTAESLRKIILNYSFLLADRIGRGYSSVVYRGLNDRTGTEVAIKVIELKSLRDATSHAMLDNEIQCLKQTCHPSLLRYEHSFRTQNNCYIITEYCPGGDLAKLIRQRGSFTEEEAGRLFLQIFQGYEHFHNAGFIHRDIKPANILVTADSALKIADFGFSKRRSLVERENYNVGTPIYMPKESLTANIYNEKTDIWALGITLYEMLFGCVPFRGKNQHQLRAEIEKGVINFPDSKPISQQLKSFISSCLNADSFKRLSIRQMHKHPWMQRVKRENGRQGRSQLPLRNEQQQKQMRISLPNQGVTHNKSKDYFQKLNIVQNRRSISSMQKLKLCHPKKGSQINIPSSLPRQPLGNKSMAAINLTMPLHKRDESVSKGNSSKKQHLQISNNQSAQNKQNIPSNRPSLSIHTLETAAKLDKPTNKEQMRLKNGIQKVVSLINYFRLLYKIAEKISQAGKQVLDTEVRVQLSKMSSAVLNNLRNNFQMHILGLSSKENLFGLNAKFWTQFVSSDRWSMYCFVIKRYQQKYESVLKGGQIKESESVSWRKRFLQFYSRIKQIQSNKVLLVKQRYILCELSYLLQTLVEMDQIVIRSGWQDFTEQYGNTEQFVPEGFSISMANYYQIDEKVRNKYASLRTTQ